MKVYLVCESYHDPIYGIFSSASLVAEYIKKTHPRNYKHFPNFIDILCYELDVETIDPNYELGLAEVKKEWEKLVMRQTNS